MKRRKKLENKLVLGGTYFSLNPTDKFAIFNIYNYNTHMWGYLVWKSPDMHVCCTRPRLGEEAL